MSTAWTYASLKAAIADHVEDPSDEFDDDVDVLIRLAEDECLKTLDLEIFKATDSVTFTQGNPLAPKPTGYIQCESFFYTVSSVRYFLEQRSYDFLVDYSPNASTEGLPKYWAEVNETQVAVAASPNAAVAAGGGTMRFLKRPESIVTVADGTTWLGTNVGDLLFAACMKNADRFDVADERIAMWQGEFDRLSKLALIQFKHLRSVGFSPLAAQPEPKGEER